MRSNADATMRPRTRKDVSSMPFAPLCEQVIGTYGIALVHRDIPDFIVGARRGSPLVLGVGKEENFLASDVSAIVAHTRDAVYLNDFDVVAVERDKFEISSVAGEAGNYQLSKVEFSDADIKKGDYPHYMLKEIFEQPGSVRDAMRGRLSLEECTAKLGGLNMTPAQLRDVGRVVLTGCGTALHAAMIGEYLDRGARPDSDRSGIRQRVSPPQHTDDARHARLRDQSEWRNGGHARCVARKPAQRVIARSEFATTSPARSRGKAMAAFTCTPVLRSASPPRNRSRRRSTILTAIGLAAGTHAPSLDFRRNADHRSARSVCPAQIEEVLKLSDQIKAIAKKYASANGMLFFGRQFNFPVALEGALKMKEITYLFAEGHPSAELKHGIIALVRPDLPSVFIAPDDAVFSKNVNNIEQVRARKGPDHRHHHRQRRRTNSRRSPTTLSLSRAFPIIVSPILTVIPLQLLAYHLAVELGRDVDKPRNLAKSVTVE